MRLSLSYYRRPSALPKLVRPSFALAKFFLSRKHGFAMLVHKRLKYTLLKKSAPMSETEWLCVDIDGNKIINACKPSPTPLQASNLPVFALPCPYADILNCSHADWECGASNVDGKCVTGWARINRFAFLYDPKDSSIFHSDH